MPVESLRYRDPQTGRFLSRRAAKRRRTRVSTESYSYRPHLRTRRIRRETGFFSDHQTLVDRTVLDPAVRAGVARSYAEAYLDAYPSASLTDIIDSYLDISQEQEIRFALDLLEDLDEDKEFYKDPFIMLGTPKLSVDRYELIFHFENEKGRKWQKLVVVVDTPLFRPKASDRIKRIIVEIISKERSKQQKPVLVYVVLHGPDGFRTIYRKTDIYHI